jgi:flagellar hook-associated protein 1 FlgK
MGSITQALRTAQSGLLVNQRVMDTIAQNVTNVNTEGYSRKIVRLENQALAGTGAGVKISSITRQVDEGLLRSVRLETSELNQMSVQQDYWARLQDLFGAPGDNTSISHVMDEFARAVETLVATPERALEKTDVVRQAENVTLLLQDLSTNIQELRLQADQELADIATRMNTLVNEIDQLNDDIVSNGTVSRDTTDLRDQRDQRITELSELVDIRYFFRSDGDVAIFTSDGSTLVDTIPPAITHTAAAAVTPTTTHGEGDFSGFFIGDTSIQANDKTTEFRGGQVKGLIDMRDTFLPDLQSQLDQLAATLRDSVNQIHNSGVSFPGAQEYNGTRTFIEPTTQAIQLDPTNSADDVSIILFDSSGDEGVKTTLNTIMTDAGFSARGSGNDWHINDIATTMQNWLRNNGAPSATVATNTAGKFDIAISNTSLNLAFRDETATANGSTQANAEIAFDANGDGFVDETVSGFSNFFGLNDFFVDSLTDNVWESDVQASSYVSAGGTLTFRDSTGLIGTLTVGANSSLSSIVTAINNDSTLSQTFTAGMIPDGSGERIRISHNNGSSFQLTDGNNETILSGAGIDLADVRTSTTLSVRSDILSNPGRIATGTVQWDAARGNAGEYFMSTADETTVAAMAAALTGTTNFSVAGGLSNVSNTFSQRAASIIATNANLANDNERDISSQRALQESLVFKQTSEAGVNLDEELANLIIFEQAFSASARVISTINDMFDALERIV